MKGKYGRKALNDSQFIEYLYNRAYAEKVAKSRTAITNSLRLLKLDERVQEMVIEGKLSSGHARAIISIEDKEKQLEEKGNYDE